MKKNTARALLRSGFTLPDMIIVMAIIAVLIGALYPAVSDSILRGKQREEVAAQKNIINMFETYLQETGQIPANILSATNFNQAWNRTNTAFTSNVVVGNLSLNDMRDDVFDARRGLFVEEQVVTFNGGSYSIYYVAVISMGADGCYGAAPCGTDAIPGSLAAITAPTGTFDLSDYNDLEADPDSDDVITKFTDAKFKADAYGETLERIGKVEEDLDFYANQKRLRAQSLITQGCQATVTMANSIYNCYEDVRAGLIPAIAAEMPDDQVFVPPSFRMSSGTVVAPAPVDERGARLDRFDVAIGGTRLIINETTAANASFGTGVNAIDNSSNVANRKAGMKVLMSVLGLPSKYCCHPLEKYFNATTGEWEETPLYYYSNPRRAGTSCRGPMQEREVRISPNSCGRCTAGQESSNSAC